MDFPLGVSSVCRKQCSHLGQMLHVPLAFSTVPSKQSLETGYISVRLQRLQGIVDLGWLICVPCRSFSYLLCSLQAALRARHGFFKTRSFKTHQTTVEIKLFLLSWCWWQRLRSMNSGIVWLHNYSKHVIFYEVFSIHNGYIQWQPCFL